MQKTKVLISSIAAAAIMASTSIPAMALESEVKTGAFLSNIDIAPKDIVLVVSLNKNKVVSGVGSKVKLDAEISNQSYDVSFRSTNKKVAKVSRKGKVTLKKKGKARIIAECNGVKAVCKVTVKEKGYVAPEDRNTIETSKMSSIASSIGKQTDYAYGSSTVMCSAYSFAYAYYQVTGTRRSAGSFWTSAGCNWAGGTYHRYGSSSQMLKAIKNSLDKNQACVGLLRIGRSSQHYVTFYGYNNKGNKLSDFKILDPWGGNLTTGANYGYCWRGYHMVTVNT